VNKFTFLLGTAMSSMDPPNEKPGNVNPKSLLFLLVSWFASNSGRVHCGEAIKLSRAPSNVGAMATPWVHFLIPNLHPLLPSAAHLTIPSLNAIVALKHRDENLSVLCVQTL